MAGKGIIDVGDGQGLNPLLQYWTMVIHPPMLYLGLRRLRRAVRVCDGVADHQAAGRRLDSHHAPLDHRDLAVPKHRHSAGQGWAYAVLGWGGYWGWDPVENASLLPWITATAFLHSVMMQEKKGMMKVWNMVLVSATFFLCIFGTLPDALGRGQFGARLRAIADRQVFRDVFLAVGIAATVILDPGAAGVPEERSAPGKRGLARIQFPVQQPDPAGQLLRGAVGHAVPGDLGSADAAKRSAWTRRSSIACKFPSAWC